MATDPGTLAGPQRRRLAENGALGMALFVFTEIMLFAGFMSAFAIVRGTVLPGLWPPPDQPRLPVERTAINTAALLASGVAMAVSARRFRRGDARGAEPWMAAALGLGTFFVFFQGLEWMALIHQGLTLTSSQLGSFFYVIIGAHALHAIAAIIGLGLGWRALRAGRLTRSRLGAVELFWYFVVLVWPVLYWQVYR